MNVFELEGEEFSRSSRDAICAIMGDDGGSAVAAVLDRDMRFMPCGYLAGPSLFTDCDMVLSLKVSSRQ